MIWFTCKSCNKKHGRAESLSGTLVFCECGTGNRVPWQSTTTAPETPPPPPPRPAPPQPPRMPPPPPMPLGRRPPPVDDDDYSPPADILRPRRTNVFRRRKPGFCFNHDEIATEAQCADCKEWFCPNCATTLQGKTLCGPCTNYRVRAVGRPARLSPLALIALLVGLVSGPVSFCLPLIGAGGGRAQLGVTIALCVVGLLLPAGGLFLSLWALRDVESKPYVSGRALALTGASSSLVGVLWCVTLAFLMVFKQVQG
jgi:hypothetical protein